jgi:NADPH-dependent glutamate synthase beta subunit-like oxidoreductase
MAKSDITKPIDLTSHAEGTGPLRFRRPEYTDFMPPCNSACPAGENIQAWLSHAQAGNYYEAYQQLMEDNPFPAIMGRVCVKACETGCNRNHIDNTVNIHAVERYIGDKAIEENWQPHWETKPTGKRVMVVGAGPGGLSAAYHLARLGHTVEVFDAASAAGGLMRFGIPEYRLPREILELEIGRIKAMGVHIHLNHKVTDLMAEKEKGKFDAVYLSTGAQLIHTENIQVDSQITIMDAFHFLREFTNGNETRIGKTVVVYGGGKLAMYIARIVKRLGAEAIVLFPGDRKLMPAYDYEADDALSEGVDIQFMRRIHSIDKNVFKLEKMKVEKGKAIGTGEWDSVKADSLIVALTQEADTSYLRAVPGIALKDDGTLVINPERMTGQEGIFGGGDMLPGETRSVTISIGHGKKASKYINAYLNGETFNKPAKHPTAGYRKLHMWYKTDAPLQEQAKLVPWVAVRSFDEVISGLSEREARYEAQRCLSCGNCFECDGCFGACPEEAIIKLGPGKGYRFDLNKCTGCAVCYEQCPCHAIEMIPEPNKASTDVN